MQGFGRKDKRKQPAGRPVREAGLDDVYWIHLAYDRDQWRAPVDPAINLPVP
jgi:hypothetical protein